MARRSCTRVLGALLLCLAFVVGACGDDTDTSTPPPAVGGASNGDTAPDSPTSGEGPTPNAAPSGDASPAASSGPLDVQILTSDDVTISAADFGDTAPVAVLLGHMRGADKQTWFDFAAELAERGVRALAIDFRGYGASDGERDTNLDVDYAAAIDFLRATGAETIHLVGASMGGTAAVVTAAREPVASVVSISGPGEFAGLDAIAASGELSVPAMFVAASDDPPYTDAALEMGARSNGRVEILEGSAHGTGLFAEQDPALTEMLLEFLGVG